jgi:hypothetical protein
MPKLLKNVASLASPAKFQFMDDHKSSPKSSPGFTGFCQSEAARRGLSTTGTLGVLLDAGEAGLIDPPHRG